MIGLESERLLLPHILKVPAKVKDNDGISTFGLLINYDSRFLTPIDIECGIWSNEIIANLDYDKNKIFVTGASTRNKTGYGELDVK